MSRWIEHILISRESGRLRSGWRVMIFLLALIVPPSLWRTQDEAGESGSAASVAAHLEVGIDQVLNYLPLVIWVLIVSWGCLALLESQGLGALGLRVRAGWWRDFQRGLLMATLMVFAIFLLQALAGGSRLTPNPYWWPNRTLEAPALRHALAETAWALLMLTLAAFFEELLYRGYAFQTLLRGTHPLVPITILSALFGLSHLGNPNSNALSTANTILAGIWLSVAYLRSRNLWFPAGLHLGWNIALGPVLGLPVSGRLIPAHPLLLSSSASPVWLTGGEYGSEGGAAATLVLIGAIFIIGRRQRWPIKQTPTSDQSTDGA
ncbi:MAG: hypothetical protein RIR52_2218 [Acidobacteriota bacterium]